MEKDFTTYKSSTSFDKIYNTESYLYSIWFFRKGGGIYTTNTITNIPKDTYYFDG